MIYLYNQIDCNFGNQTKFVSQFLDTYKNLYQLYKTSSEIEMEKLLLIPKKKKKWIQPRGPPTRGPRARWPTMGEPARAGAFAKEPSDFSQTTPKS